MAYFAPDSRRLTLNFSQSFLPERRLLSLLLPFASANGGGDKVEIGASTGIPTGESSGKVEPMINYACAMGLIRADRVGSRWRLGLTTLGSLIAVEDPYLSESVTLWLLHLLLCRRGGLGEPPTGVADAWFALFAEGPHRLGARFSQSAYFDYLSDRHEAASFLKGVSGLVLRSYVEPSCFGSINALTLESIGEENYYLRRSAPVERSHFPVYSAYLFTVWDELFSDLDQLELGELFERSRCLAVIGWEKNTAARWLDWMVDKRLLQLDRQTGGTIALRLHDTATVIGGVFDELT